MIINSWLAKMIEAMEFLNGGLFVWLKKDNSDFLNGLLDGYASHSVYMQYNTSIHLFTQWQMDLLWYTRNCTSRGFQIIVKSYAYCKLKTNKTINYRTLTNVIFSILRLPRKFRRIDINIYAHAFILFVQLYFKLPKVL